ncbi:hypothetical protein [Mesorhizobium sp. M0578]|uniref:hypothetical protein n=1 Tax=unclassified Mesorhizobium TaxID=325217 RepID=UPI003335C3EE
MITFGENIAAVSPVAEPSKDDARGRLGIMKTLAHALRWGGKYAPTMLALTALPRSRNGHCPSKRRGLMRK